MRYPASKLEPSAAIAFASTAGIAAQSRATSSFDSDDDGRVGMLINGDGVNVSFGGGSSGGGSADVPRFEGGGGSGGGGGATESWGAPVVQAKSGGGGGGIDFGDDALTAA